MMHVLGLMLLVVGLAVGLRLPDIDQSTDLLLHRSIITHGPLIPFLLFVVAVDSRLNPFRWFAVGLSLGFAVHLAFDLFPQGWVGYALVSLPSYGWTPAPVSWAWIAISVVLCAYLAAKLVRGCLETTLFVLGLAGGFAYAAFYEGELWLPAAAVVVAGLLALALTRRDRASVGTESGI